MKKSKRPPRAFAQWCRANAPVEGRAWEELDTAAKDALRDTLRADQGGLCAYCLVALGPDTKIEHVAPQAPDTTFDWSNLALCCPGRTDGASHCDTAKADRVLTDIHPYRRPVAERARLRLGGRLQPLEGAEIDVDETLRLNTRSLRDRRDAALRASLADVEARADIGHIPPGKLQRALDELDRTTRPVPYGPFIAAWLRRQIPKR